MRLAIWTQRGFIRGRLGKSDAALLALSCAINLSSPTMLKWMLGTVKALLLTGLSFVTLILRCGRKKKLASGGYIHVDQNQQHKVFVFPI